MKSQHLALGMAVIGLSLHPAKAVPLTTGPIKVKVDDLMTLTYNYKFSHGEDVQGQWKYKFRETDRINASEKKEILYTAGVYDEKVDSPIIEPPIKNPNFYATLGDILGHGSLAVFRIRPFQWLENGQELFEVSYETAITASCANEEKGSCEAIDSELVLNTKLGDAQPVKHIHATFNIAEPEPVPGPLPLLGVGAAFGFSRKLRKRIKNSKLPEVMSTIR